MERALAKASGYGVRAVALRIGLVLGTEGGLLARLLLPFEFGMGGRISSGKQWMSWIHNDDLVGTIVFALENGQASGPINGTAPEPVRNREFATALGRALHRPSFLPTPAFALRMMLGKVAEVVTTGQLKLNPGASVRIDNTQPLNRPDERPKQ